MTPRWLSRGLAGCAAVLLMGFAAIALGGGAIDSSQAPPMPDHVDGIDPTVLAAYGAAADAAAQMPPHCDGMRWSVLAGVGMVESRHAAGHVVDPAGSVAPLILGPVLDGSGAGGNTSAVLDTDDGRFDGDRAYDRAVGPMQFLPGTWVEHGRDGNGDGRRDPHNIVDAAFGAAFYLCGTSETNLYDDAELDRALRRYNDSAVYVAEVTSWISTYDEIAAESPPDAFGDSGALGDRIVAAARSQLGVPYSWGGGNASGPTLGFCCSPGGASGAGTAGFDCSGLTTYAAAQVGVRLPRQSAAQFVHGPGTQIWWTDGLGVLRPGDLVFFAANQNRPETVHHVGIYVGGGRMINAPRTGATVREEPVWLDRYIGARRLVSDGRS